MIGGFSPPYSNTEEWLSSATHAIGFVMSAIGLVILWMRVDDIYSQVVYSVYCLSMMGMFLSSTLYHGAREPNVKAKLKIVDHSAIYILIAGTYTPFLLLTVGGEVGFLSLLLIWFIAFLGVGFKCLFANRWPKLSLITYLFLGWLAVALIYPLYHSLSAQSFWLLLAGGGCYTVGVIFYVAKSIPYTHAVWHLFVAAGCVCHYFSIYHNA
ncbi:hemolysin III family protein [Paraglaciecola aquimarina]|uniref:Hemolysin III family protein n=1 Tax=Paraglaciecola aquimarina TaxID=1235557 RepID=A0ABU3T1U6_9ALTE|nr:hemolysin III family protein [Paraglaciecola aquimarina]MDU0356236.1 hemolysin III family protein [Paraglaciecola aquimarina]